MLGQNYLFEVSLILWLFVCLAFIIRQVKLGKTWSGWDQKILLFSLFIVCLFKPVPTGVYAQSSSLDNSYVVDPWQSLDEGSEMFETEVIVEAPIEIPVEAAEVEPEILPNNTYIVVAGDNLWDIAEKLDPENVGHYWSNLVELNRANLISQDPNLIYPGEVLKLN